MQAADVFFPGVPADDEIALKAIGRLEAEVLSELFDEVFCWWFGFEGRFLAVLFP